MYLISKSFEFDYGHSVWTQDLDNSLSLCSCNVCRHDHGHRAKVSLFFSRETLDSRGMVIDFKELNYIRWFFDNHLDHKMILDIHDPSLLERFFIPLSTVDGDILHITEEIDLFPNLEHIDRDNFGDDLKLRRFDMVEITEILSGSLTDKKAVERSLERYSGTVFTPFVPTSENLSNWIYKIVKKVIPADVKLERIEFKETPKTSAIYM